MNRPAQTSQSYADDAKSAAESIADSLDRLAARLRQQAQGLSTAGGNVGHLAAGLVNEYTQALGGNGSFLAILVRCACQAEYFQALAKITELNEAGGR